MLLFVAALVFGDLFRADAVWQQQTVIGHDVMIGKCDPMIPCSTANSECYEGMCVCKAGHVPIYKNTYTCQQQQEPVQYQSSSYSRYGTTTTSTYNSCIESCLPVSDYKMTCLNDQQCKPKLGKFGSCIRFLDGSRGGVCGCRAPSVNSGGYGGYHYVDGKCWPARQIGYNCRTHSSCITENSFCDDPKMNSTEMMRRYGTTSYKTCKCLDEFPVYFEPDDKCLQAAGYGASCEFSDQCRSELGFGATCLAGSGSPTVTKTCKCRSGYAYDKDANKCLAAKKTE